MKQFFAALLALALLLSACGQDGAEATVPEATVPETTEAAPAPVDPVIAQAQIRYAIGLLLDRNYLVFQLCQGGQTPAASFVPRGLRDADGTQFWLKAGGGQEHPGYYSVAREGYEENYDRAMAILSQYYTYGPNGKFRDFPPLTCLCGESEQEQAIGAYLQEALAMVGISLELRQEGPCSMALTQSLAPCDDPLPLLKLFESGSNAAGLGQDAHGELSAYSLDLTDLGYDIQVEKGTWQDTYDVLLAQIAACQDSDTRYALMHRAEDLLMDTGAVVPLYFSTDVYLLDSAVEGLYRNRQGWKFLYQTKVGGKTEALSVCLGEEIESPDPAFAVTLAEKTLASHLFAGLARWEPGAHGEAVVVSDCLEAFSEPERNPDGTLTYTYTLKEGLCWSDGKALTAGDFAASWKRAAALGNGNSQLFQVIQGYPKDLAVTAPDERTLSVTLTGPVPYWKELLADPAFFPVQPNNPYVSNGAYTVSAWEPGLQITLEKNPRYHLSSFVTMQTLQFFQEANFDTALARFQEGAWQLIVPQTPAELSAAKAQSPAALQTAALPGTTYLCWNVNTPLLPQE